MTVLQFLSLLQCDFKQTSAAILPQSLAGRLTSSSECFVPSHQPCRTPHSIIFFAELLIPTLGGHEYGSKIHK